MNKACIVYLHGFLSSPNSEKAQRTKYFLTQHYPDVECIIPALAHHPDAVKQQLLEIIQQNSVLGFVGSSLGGYFALWCARLTNKPAVLINPALKPYLLLADYLGQHIHPYTNELVTVTPEFNDALRQFEVEQSDALKLKVLVQTGDETLDYRLALQQFNPDQLYVEQGGNHAFVNFEQHLSTICQFILAQA